MSLSKLSSQRYNKTNPVLGRASVYFDGSGDYLSMPSTSAFTMGTGSFTIEFWARSATTFASTNIYAFDMATNTAVNGTRAQFYNNSIYWGPVAGTALTTSGLSGVTANSWHHYALVRNGSTLTGYLDGTSLGSVSNSSDQTDTMCTIGSYNSTYSGGGGGGFWNGYISNFRIVKGTAVYTSNFTVPTAPLAAISGTTFLTCQNATNIVDAGPNALTITANGNAVASTTHPF